VRRNAYATRKPHVAPPSALGAFKTRMTPHYVRWSERVSQGVRGSRFSSSRGRSAQNLFSELRSRLASLLWPRGELSTGGCFVKGRIGLSSERIGPIRTAAGLSNSPERRKDKNIIRDSLNQKQKTHSCAASFRYLLTRLRAPSSIT